MASELVVIQRKARAAEIALTEVKRQHQQARDAASRADGELARLRRLAAMTAARAAVEPLFVSGVPIWALRDALANDSRLGLTVRL